MYNILCVLAFFSHTTMLIDLSLPFAACRDEAKQKKTRPPTGVGLETVAAIWVFGPFSMTQCVYERSQQQPPSTVVEQPNPMIKMEVPTIEEEEEPTSVITIPCITEDTITMMDDEEIFHYVPPCYHDSKKNKENKRKMQTVYLTPNKKQRTADEKKEEEEYPLPFTSSDELYNHTFAVPEPFPVSSFFPSLNEEDNEAMTTMMVEPGILPTEPTPEEIKKENTERERCFRQMSNHLHTLLALFDSANPRNHTITVRSLAMAIADSHEELRALGCLQEFEATHPTLVSGVQIIGYYPIAATPFP